MKNTIRDIRVAKQIGKDSDAVEAPAGGRTLFLSGTPGLTKDGHLPASFEEQARAGKSRPGRGCCRVARRGWNGARRSG